MTLACVTALVSCSRGEGTANGAPQVGGVKAVSSTEEAPKPGTCGAWTQPLADGEPAATSRVTDCLKALARADRPAAVRQARALLSGGIKRDTGLMLGPLARTLVAFPEEGQLKGYLARLGVLSGAGAGVPIDQPLTADEYLRLQGRLYDFDVETGTFPNGHNWLLEHLAALADSGLKSATFEETPPTDPDDEEQPYLLTGRLDGRTWQLQAANYGDWYDVTAVLALLNRMATEGGYPERFITLDTGDQSALVVAVNQTALRELVTRGLFELADAERARALGHEFEAGQRRVVRAGHAR